MIKAITDRPWIWIIVGSAVIMSATLAFVLIAVKYGPKEVPVPHSQGDY